MARWHRTVPFSADWQPARVERWDYQAPDGTHHSFEVEVRAGKPFDVMKLKGGDPGETRAYATLLEHSARALYDGSARPLEKCPVCRAGMRTADVELRVFGVPYLRCADCGHVAAGLHPAPGALERLFAESEAHSAAYVDKAAVEARISEIVAPKLAWCLEQYRRRGGNAPRRVVDVGAGAGHFVAGARRGGYEATGFEKSRASRTFAKEAFGIDLRDDDFTAAQVGGADLVTFWGLLEYLHEPRPFLAAARRAIAPGGLLVAEVPRADALGTRVQAAEGAVVARHMDPTTHVNAFSDESLCTALVEEGFAPVAAWYFGMDAYETVVQAALRGGKAPEEMAWLLGPLQQAADLGRQCDDIVVAAVPLAE